VSPEATKAFYRRAQAHMGMNDFDLAQQDLERVLGLASDDAAIQRDVRAQLKALDLKRRQHDQRMGQMYARMLRDDA
jgi:FK506-binding protein 4/5